MTARPQKSPSRLREIRRGIRTATFLFLGLAGGCTVQSSVSSHYLTAEKLWTEKNYAAAVAEFDRVVKEAPDSAVGLQALWRASMTRELFLGEPEIALNGFGLFLERAANSDLAPQAQLEIGEIYFSRLNQYKKAIEHYQRLLEGGRFSPEEASRFHYRIGRSYFREGQIREAIRWYEKGLGAFPESGIALKMRFDLASSWYALGDSEKGAYGKALKYFEEAAAQAKNQDHRIEVESLMGKAQTLEELDRLEEAFALFESIEKDYPAPNVIRVRMHRVSERMKKKRK